MITWMTLSLVAFAAGITFTAEVQYKRDRSPTTALASAIVLIGTWPPALYAVGWMLVPAWFDVPKMMCMP
jgi:hypothetical protein